MRLICYGIAKYGYVHPTPAAPVPRLLPPTCRAAQACVVGHTRIIVTLTRHAPVRSQLVCTYDVLTHARIPTKRIYVGTMPLRVQVPDYDNTNVVPDINRDHQPNDHSDNLPGTLDTNNTYVRRTASQPQGTVLRVSNGLNLSGSSFFS